MTRGIETTRNFIAPAWKEPDLGAALLERCETRARAWLASQPEQGEMTAKTYVAHINQRDLASVQMAGYNPVKYHFQMQIELSETLPEPRWPEGITVRTAIPGQGRRVDGQGRARGKKRQPEQRRNEAEGEQHQP